MSDGSLAGKVAIVWGGGGAIGGACARAFARDGAQVFLAGRTATKLARVAQDITAAGGRADVATLDVFDAAAVHAHADRVAEVAGRIDILMNAVGIAHVQGKSFAETSLAEFEAPITANARAQFVPAQAAAKHMIARRAGVILTMTTPGGRITGKGFLANGVFSAATEAFSRLLAAELGGFGIRTVCLRPDAIPDALTLSHSGEVFAGFADKLGISIDDMLAEHGRKSTLLGRLPTLREVADTAAFVASDRAGAMTGGIVNLTCGSMADL
ncbi:MAG TPA: SDR family oxidoreductase [Steroidobacteraceae bacterium]|nr:SDR family oxidoreductase [Steroidobacteraceae bacterium]